ncbi:MAG: hypothetical protein EHM35_00475 [Planctomycetaceae bacterium]|nr:MAG: hypothetical protein EHM35_00475 [Planctomycetaceae bacterium]
MKGENVDKFDWDQANEIVDLDLDGKIKMLGAVARELLGMKVELAAVSGRHAELKANLAVLSAVKSALQSSIRAEQAH